MTPMNKPLIGLGLAIAILALVVIARGGVSYRKQPEPPAATKPGEKRPASAPGPR